MATPLLIVVLAGCHQAQDTDEWSDFTQPKALDRVGLQYYWSLQAPLGKDEQIRCLSLVDEKLYCLTSQNRLVAIDAATGGSMWSLALANPSQRVFPPVHANAAAVPPWDGDVAKDRPSTEMIAKAKPFDAVVLNTLSHILVINRVSGEIVSSIPLPFVANSGGATDGTAYYVASVDGSYHAIDLRSTLELWKRDTGGMVSAAPRLMGGVLYVAGEDQVAYATQTATGRSLWTSRDSGSTPMHGPVTADIAVDASRCYVPCGDNRLYVYDRLTGKCPWEPFVCQGPLQQGVQVGEATIFQNASRDKFYAIDAASGTQRWSRKGGGMILAATKEKGNEVYLLDNSDNVYTLDEITGASQAVWTVFGFDVFAPNATAPAMYAASAGGRVVCIRPRSAGLLSPEMLRPAAPLPAAAPK
ncbi:MAG: PQQ-binding-like beta-propeller repeat protein [Phycisphaerae bacterium]